MEGVQVFPSHEVYVAYGALLSLFHLYNFGQMQTARPRI